MPFQWRSLGPPERLTGLLEKNGLLLFAVFSVFYAGAVYLSSRRKLLWNDELYTYYIARLPGMTEVWSALMTGGEQLPPFFYLITRASIGLFGLNAFALRLPAMVGFWIMCLCLFVFVSRRTSKLYGLMASVFPLITFPFFYSYEARPYGIVLGFCALALLSWQSATMNTMRIASLIGLTLSIAGALSSHYYGIFVIFPLALGEAVRTYHRKRLDAPVWLAFLLALTPHFWHLPLIGQARAYSTAFWAPPQWMNIASFYFNTLFMAVLPLFLILLIAGIYHAVRRNEQAAADQTAASPLPVHELAASFGFLLVPVICVFLAKTLTGAFTDRYAVSAIIGLSLVITFAVSKICRNDATAAAGILLCVIGWFGFLFYNENWKASTASDSTPQMKITLVQEKGEADLPIVTADPYTFIELEHYAPPDVRSRVVYLADPEAALRHLKHNSIERGIVDLIGPWFGMNVVDYNSYMAARPRFLLCGDPNFFSWIVPQLEADGMRFELKGLKGKIMLFSVTPHDPEDASQATGAAVRP
jgi:cbb3-type cytochrome oxidase subunit 3